MKYSQIAGFVVLFLISGLIVSCSPGASNAQPSEPTRTIEQNKVSQDEPRIFFTNIKDGETVK